MAYIIPPNDPNAPATAGAMGAPGALNQPPTTSAGGTATSASAPGSPQGAASQPNATQAPPVQDLKAYLAANAPQSVQMGQNIANDLNQTAGKVTGDINAAQQDVASQVAAQNTAPNQALIEQAATNPADFVTNDQNVKDFLAQENANYGGPANFESTAAAQPLQTEVANAQQKAPDITKPQGVEQLARSQEVNPTTGMSNLDALLLQESPGALEPINAALPGVRGLSDYLSGAAGTTNDAIRAAIAQDQADKAAVQNTFLTGSNAVVPTFQNQLKNELSTTKGTATDAATRAKSDLIAGKPTADDLKILGIEPGQMNEIESVLKSLQGDYGKNFDLSNYATMLGPDNVFANVNATATPKEYAKEAALSKLLEGGFNPSLDQSFAGNSGKQNNSLLNFDSTGAQGDANNALKQNDIAELTKNLSFTDNFGRQKNYTLEQLLNDTNVRNDAIGHIRDPKDRQRFEDAMSRYVLEYTGGPQGPQAPTGAPIGFQSPAPGIY